MAFFCEDYRFFKTYLETSCESSCGDECVCHRANIYRAIKKIDRAKLVTLFLKWVNSIIPAGGNNLLDPMYIECALEAGQNARSTWILLDDIAYVCGFVNWEQSYAIDDIITLIDRTGFVHAVGNNIRLIDIYDYNKGITVQPDDIIEIDWEGNAINHGRVIFDPDVLSTMISDSHKTRARCIYRVIHRAAFTANIELMHHLQ